MSNWRMVGLNYVNYSTIAARVLRRSLKPAFKDEAEKRDAQLARIYYWLDGQVLPYGEKPKNLGDASDKQT